MPDDRANVDIARINKALLDAFPLSYKSDALAGYLYLKYIYQFGYRLLNMMGRDVREPHYQPVDEGTAEMTQLFADQVCERSLSKETSIMHSKIVRPEDALKLISQTENLHLVPSEKVIPFKLTREIILESPSEIAIGRCMCRGVAAHPCVPPSEQDLCMWIGEPNVSFLVSQNPYFRKVTPKEAGKILEDAHKAGFIHCAYFEKPASDRFNCICNCCSCCCMSTTNWHLFGSNDNPFLAPSGYVPDISDACNGCGDCARACGFHAITVDEGSQKAVVDLGKCMGCTLCEDRCPLDAIKMRPEPSIGDPLDIEALKRQSLSARQVE